MENVYWPGVIGIVVTYALVLLVGLRVSRKPDNAEDNLEELMLAGRSLPLWVALLTMTATWVGGGYINGTAEQTFSSGIVWGLLAGVGYAVSLVIGGLFFARPMRRRRYTTLVDPFEQRYGPRVALVLMLPAILGEIFWTAAILVALGSTFGSVIGLDLYTSTIVSAAIAIGYTTVGGLRAVAYTDVIQLAMIFIGLLIALPFVIDAAGGAGAVADNAGVAWHGFKNVSEGLQWSEWALLFALGGIPWNVYFQRVLSSSSADVASRQSLLAAPLCFLFALLPMVLALCAMSIEWAPEVGKELVDTPTLVLPYLLRFGVPDWVSVIALAAVAAAVMSSVDSSILSASSLVAWNGYRKLINPNVTASAMTSLIRFLIVFLGTIATVIALSVGSVATLWYLCGDIIYSMLFPQLLLALFYRKANAAGALTGIVASVLIRLSGGVPALGLDALIDYPGWFPFRTLAMVSGLLLTVVVSLVTAKRYPPKQLQAELSEEP